jgi:hypothetical protein
MGLLRQPGEAGANAVDSIGGYQNDQYVRCPRLLSRGRLTNGL